MRRQSPQKHRRAKRIAKRDQWGILTTTGEGLLYYDANATAWTTSVTFDTSGFSPGDVITISGTTPAIPKKLNKKVHVARRRKTKKALSSDGVYTITEIQGNTITVGAGETITMNSLYSFCKDAWI